MRTRRRTQRGGKDGIGFESNVGTSLRSRERLRKRYRPERVRILFVGEAPPASGRFFYRANSGLYGAIRDTFLAAFPSLGKDEFLQSFAALGCYLVDLCGKPVDRMDKQSRERICHAGEERLARMLRQLRPKLIVTVVRSIESNVRRAQTLAKWMGVQIALPYPGRWHLYRTLFREKLTPMLRASLATRVKHLKENLCRPAPLCLNSIVRPQRKKADWLSTLGIHAISINRRLGYPRV
jgi:hypothetical protein